jgi:hypothetical protein
MPLPPPPAIVVYVGNPNVAGRSLHIRLGLRLCILILELASQTGFPTTLLPATAIAKIWQDPENPNIYYTIPKE